MTLFQRPYLSYRNYSEVLWSMARQLGADLGGYSRRPHDFRILTSYQPQSWATLLPAK
jgi:hypothetical protein